jgi:hypothetical protein
MAILIAFLPESAGQKSIDPSRSQMSSPTSLRHVWREYLITTVDLYFIPHYY